MAYKRISPMPVIEGGTGDLTLTNHGVLVGAGTSPITQLSVGATGTVLIGNTGADPSFSTTPTVTSITISNAPVAGTDGTNKTYVDTIAAGFQFKSAALVATTTALNATYLNGAAGVGATLINAGTLAAFSVDGQSPAINSRVLVKDQASTFQNGIYTLTTVGSGAIAWVLTRATDFDQPSEIQAGDLVPVLTGTVNADTLWLQNATVTTIGTDPITFVKFLGQGITTITGDTGGALTGSNITFAGGTTGLSFGGSGTTETLTFAGITANGGTVSLATDATTSTINIGTGSGVKTSTFGSTNSTSATTVQSGSGALAVTSTNGTLTINSGTGALGISTDASATTVSFATGSAVKGVTLGSTNSTSATTVQSGSGALALTSTNGTWTGNSGTGALGLSTDSTNTTISLGTGAGAKLITLGSTNGASSLAERVGTGNFSLDGVAGSTYTVGASTTTGTITIGGTAQTGAHTFGSSSGTNIVNVGTGAGATTVNIATGATNAKAVNIATGAVANITAIGTTTASSTLTLNAPAAGLKIGGFTEGALITSSVGAVSTVTGTSGFVLTANAAGTAPSFQAAGGGSVSTATATLTSSQVKSLVATPITLISAPGSGKAIVILSAIATLHYGGTNAFTNTDSETLALFYTTVAGANQASGVILTATNITATASTTNLNTNFWYGTNGTTQTIFDNKSIVIGHVGGVEYAGNAAGDNTIVITAAYITVTL